MKIRMTRKDIVNGSSVLVKAGYCDLQTLLRNHEPIAYNCGVYGWNFDVYQVHGVTICTGYRNMPGRRADNIGRYEKLAKEICNDNSLTWNEQKERIEQLLKEFCQQA